MADRQIGDLTAAEQVAAADLFVLEQDGEAKKLTGQILHNWLLRMIDGHGGIARIAKTGSAGIDPVIDTYTITFADESTFSFTVTNGLKGDQGIPGPTMSISSQTVRYQRGTSGTVIPSGEWQETVPIVPQGDFLWTRTVVVYADPLETEVTSYSVARMGVDGNGSVSAVNNIGPDGTGNITLSPSNIGAAAVDSNNKVVASQASALIVTETSSFTLGLSHAGVMVLANFSTDGTVTVPEDADVAFPIGTEIEICQFGLGSVTFVVDGESGVTVHSFEDSVATAGQYASVCLKKIGVDEWILAGGLA